MLSFLEVQLPGKPDRSSDWLHVVDPEGDAAGAPQNVQALHQLLEEVDIPVQYEGGIQLIHTAELILGLGVDRVVIGPALKKTDRTPEHFFSRIGAKCVAAISGDEQSFALKLKEQGCARFLIRGTAEEAVRISESTGIPSILFPQRNHEPQGDVPLEGFVVRCGAQTHHGK